MPYELRPEDDTMVLVLRDQLGDVDRAAFSRVLDRIAERAPARVVVDLGALSYMDSAGLALLLSLRQRAATLPAAVVLRNARGAVRDILLMTRFEDLFRLEDAP